MLKFEISKNNSLEYWEVTVIKCDKKIAHAMLTRWEEVGEYIAAKCKVVGWES